MLSSAIAAQRGGEGEFIEGFRPRRAQDIAGIGVYVAATALAAFSPVGALALFVLVALAYLVPGLVADFSRRRKGR